MRVGTKPDSIPERLALTAGTVPTPLLESFEAMAMARAIMAGVNLGIFEALDEQPDDADRLARRLKLDRRGTDILLVALHALGYVEYRNGRYRNAPAVEKFVLPDSPQTLHAYIGAFNGDMWDEFSRTEDAIRTGESSGLHARDPDDPYWERYMRGLFDLTRLAGDDVARMIPARNPKRMLDLAGGHGGYAIAMCRRHADLTVTIVELEGAARIGREIVREQGMEDRIDFLVGDMFTTDLGDGLRRGHRVPDPAPLRRGRERRAAHARPRGAARRRHGRDPRAGAAPDRRARQHDRRADRPALLRHQPRPHLHGGRARPPSSRRPASTA